jgi:hypothetical protein
MVFLGICAWGHYLRAFPRGSVGTRTGAWERERGAWERERKVFAPFSCVTSTGAYHGVCRLICLILFGMVGSAHPDMVDSCQEQNSLRAQHF